MVDIVLVSDEQGLPFQPIQWRINLEDTILATDYFSRIGNKTEQFFPKLGSQRWENGVMGAGVYKNVYCTGFCKFVWVWNNSGSDITVGQHCIRRANQAVTNLDSGGTNYATKASTFTADKESGGLLWVQDDNGAAGASPEGLFAEIKRNTANTLYFQPDMATALAVNDDLTIVYPAHVTLGGANAEPASVVGVPVASAGIPNGYMGWLCFHGIAKVAVVAAGTAITTSKGAVAGASGLFTNGSSAALNTILGYYLHAVQSDTVARFALAWLDVNKGFGASA